MTEVLIEIPYKLNSVCIEKDMSRFFNDPSGYLTLDFGKTRVIEEGGLDQILEAADALQGLDGNLQLVNVSKDIYLHLINTNISGKRLLNLAEIYTDKELGSLGAYIRALGEDHDTFGVEERHFFNLAKEAWKEYKRLNGSEGLSKDEFKRREIEYALMLCARDIEGRNVETLDHLGYVYKETTGINSIDDIGRLDFQNKYIIKLVYGAIFQARCKIWIPPEGFGFLRYGMVDIWVHQDFIVGADELIEGKMYSFRASYVRNKGWRGRNVRLA